ncbi:ABC transporter ATP-binding protein [Pedosphaera parvula]|uniref:ABC transporter related-protein n=1 Tax=Pedosphaera parvula (strain Ellin514) TaxID=320771 RepID=B9XGB1_PEDPL|nr:ATP-binding cassette domain-containing protein [Pedosphaera parvula]EEF61273.1 ABC transporter related-protein [Pedosphaera parvula Ellin514]
MIKVQNLAKTFGAKRAVDGVSFSVERGEVLGFLGPNGAGKSTSMRMITGFIPPTAGTIHVGGFDMVENPIPAKRLIGYLPENAPAYTDMTVYGFLNFAAEIRGLRGDAKKKAVYRVVEMCFLENVLHQSVDTLSKGYRHRTCFAQSIIHDPEVLILDEPTDGLDPNQKHEVRTLIRRMGEKKAIIFSTHILEEVDAVCSRAMIIDRGKVVANGTPQELRQKSEFAGAVTLRVSGVAANSLTQKLSQLPIVKRAVVVKEGAASVTVRVFPKTAGINGALAEGITDTLQGWKIEELHTEEGRLDDVFRNITMPDTAKEKEATK